MHITQRHPLVKFVWARTRASHTSVVDVYAELLRMLTGSRGHAVLRLQRPEHSC